MSNIYQLYTGSGDCFPVKSIPKTTPHELSWGTLEHQMVYILLFPTEFAHGATSPLHLFQLFSYLYSPLQQEPKEFQISCKSRSFTPPNNNSLYRDLVENFPNLFSFHCITSLSELSWTSVRFP